MYRTFGTLLIGVVCAAGLAAGAIPAGLALDGRLDEAAWAEAEAISGLTEIEPDPGEIPSQPTTVRVLASSRALVVGVECFDERLQEISRWAGASRDYALTQTSRAGLLTELPAFDPGLGLTVRPSVIAGYGRRSSLEPDGSEGDVSLDASP